MLRKLSAVCCLGVLSFVLVGCADSATTVDKVADSATKAVEDTSSTAKDAAGSVVPDAAKKSVDGAIDHTEESAKDGIEGAAAAAKGE